MGMRPCEEANKRENEWHAVHCRSRERPRESPGRLIGSFRGVTRDVDATGQLSEGETGRFAAGTCAPRRFACLNFLASCSTASCASR
jgi:hypothetical protein